MPFKSIFYPENNKMVRGQCPGDIYDRATCNSVIEKVSASLFYRNLRAEFGKNTGAAETKLREIYVNVDRISTKIEELFLLDPANPIGQDLLAAISRKRLDLADVEILITNYNDQIFRIEQDLAAADDPNLRLVLANITSKFIAEKLKKEQLANEIAELNERYIEANSATVTDQRMFESLVAQRRHWVNQIDAANDILEYQLNEVALFHKTVKLLNDQGFAYAVVSGRPGFEEYYPIVRMLMSVFDSTLRTQ